MMLMRSQGENGYYSDLACFLYEMAPPTGASMSAD